MVMRSLTTWNPFQELSTWHRDIDDLFRRFFPGVSEENDQYSMTGWLPPMEVLERDGSYVIRADVPGVEPSEVEVSVLNDTLTVKGERKRSSEVKEKDYHYSETSYGRFERRLALPKGVDPEKIAAKFEHGVLEITMPLPASATAKKIPIEGGGAAQPKQIKAA
jgi:HSP20 family protein